MAITATATGIALGIAGLPLAAVNNSTVPVPDYRKIFQMPQADPVMGLYAMGLHTNAALSPINLPDNLGQIWEIPIGVMPIEGARIVDNAGTMEFYNRDGGGALIDPPPFFRQAPEATNISKQSDDYSSSEWIKTGIAVSTDGTSPIFNELQAELLTNTANVNSIRNYGLYDVSNSAWIISLTPYQASADWMREVVTFTVPAGCAVVRINAARETSASVIYRDVAVTPGEILTFSFYHMDGVGVTETYLAGVNLQNVDFETPAIYTEDAAAIRYVQQMEHPLGVEYLNPDEGTLVFKYTVVSDASAGDIGLFSLAASTPNILYESNANTQLRSFDGSSVNSVGAYNQIVGSNITAAVMWSVSGNRFRIGFRLNGGAYTWSIEKQYNTFTFTDTIRLFVNSDQMRKLELADVYNEYLETGWIEENY